jgi:hypothetical protein
MNRRTFLKAIFALSLSSCAGPPLSYAKDESPQPSKDDRDETCLYDSYSATPLPEPTHEIVIYRLSTWQEKARANFFSPNPLYYSQRHWSHHV